MATNKHADTPEETTPPLSCGLIMPISPIDGCSAEHWSDVKSIVQEAIDTIEKPKFITRLVSDADDIGVIQKRIVQGIYNSDVVVCDVSAKNSNVMFELGMRLAFDKPTIIIKDDKTDYSFDTSIIEHLTYPRDLRFSKIVAFKKQLADKVAATYHAATQNANHSTFLKNFGTFKVAHLDQKEGSSEQVMLEMLSELQREVGNLRRLGTARTRSEARPASLTKIVNALLLLRMEDGSLELEPTDQLVNRLVEFKNPDVTQGFSSKESFVEAVAEACDIAKRV
jgi:nucleoside 2-deoxyribosyltransferase